MRLLLDTNLYLEVLLNQEKAAQAKTLLNLEGKFEFHVSDFSLHSIGNRLFRIGKEDAYAQFIQDMVLDVGVRVVRIPPGGIFKDCSGEA